MGKTFPVRGFLPASGILIGSILTIWIGARILGIAPNTIAVFTLFATWFAFVLSTADGWPINGVQQPAKGLIFLIVCLAYGLFHLWAQPTLFGFSADYYWPIIANLFLAIGITIAFDNKLVAGLKQPVALIMNILFWYLLTFLLLSIVPLNNGMVPAIWFAWFLLYFFWADRYPISELPQPAKAILSFCVMVGGGVLLNYIFIWFFHTSFFQPDAGAWFAAWVFWLVISSWIFDTWPFQAIRQPIKAGLGLVTTVLLASLTYYIAVFIVKLDLPSIGSYIWIFISWGYLWPICFGKWPATEKIAVVSTSTKVPSSQTTAQGAA